MPTTCPHCGEQCPTGDAFCSCCRGELDVTSSTDQATPSRPATSKRLDEAGHVNRGLRGVQTHDVIGIVLSGLYALFNYLWVMSPWHHPIALDEDSFIAFMIDHLFVFTLVVLTLYYAFISYRGLHPGCVIAAYFVLLASAAYTEWYLLRAMADV